MRSALLVVVCAVACGGTAPPTPPDAADVAVTDAPDGADVVAVDAPVEAAADVTVDVAPPRDVGAAEASVDASADGGVADAAADAAPDLVCAPADTICGGRCVNLGVDAMNCGACGVVCTEAPEHARPVCRTTCGWGCDTGYRNCNGDPADGCETRVLPDAGCPR